jgi:prevent-host-death family protein
VLAEKTFGGDDGGIIIELDWLALKSYYSFMKKASITETKNKLSALIDGLKSGSPVLIVDRGRPVARLEAVTDDELDGKLARLAREGIVRPGRTRAPRTLFTEQPPRLEKGVSALEALIEERREGR